MDRKGDKPTAQHTAEDIAMRSRARVEFGMQAIQDADVVVFEGRVIKSRILSASVNAEGMDVSRFLPDGCYRRTA